MHDIRHISLHGVQLNSETWNDVIWRSSCVTPHLIDLYIQLCGYSSTGLNSAFTVAIENNDVVCAEDGRLAHLETKHSHDLEALGHLQRVVNLRRFDEGLGPFSDLGLEDLVSDA